MTNPITLTYQTIKTIPREGTYGQIMGWIAAHPVLAGLIGGGGAIAVALMRSSKGAMQAPGIAIILSLVVLASWVVIFWFMRSFFEQQTTLDIDVIRKISFAPDHFTWKEEDTTRLEFSPEGEEELICKLVTRQVPENAKNKDLPWPVWLVIENDAGAHFVLETRIRIEEARQYESAPEDIEDKTHEQLPAHIVSPLLESGRKASGV